MAGLLREYSGSLVLSLLLHGLIAAAFILAAVMHFSTAPPLASAPAPIDAVVVDSQILHAADQAKAAAAAATEAAAARAKADAQAAADAKAAAEAKAAADAKAAEDARAASAAQAAAELARSKAAADASAVAAAQAAGRQRAEQAAREAAKQAAAARQAADAKRESEAKSAADARRAAEQRAKAEREEELRRQIADEEHVSAVESGPLADRYRLSLENRIIHAWLKPPSARLGIDCRVEVTQVPGGEVVGARVTQCNGDAAVRQSIENAVYRASPLPEPPDPALFHRTFVFEFKPNE